jgi:protoheme IX farnesyltransferase
LIYTLLLAPMAVGLGFTTVGGPVYLAGALLMNAWFVKGAFEIWRRDEAMAEADKYKTEKAFFKFSIYYLFLHFGAILVDLTLSGMGVL